MFGTTGSGSIAIKINFPQGNNFVQVVTVVGQSSYKSSDTFDFDKSKSWILTGGQNSDVTTNEVIYDSTAALSIGSEYGKEIIVNRQISFLGFIKNGGGTLSFRWIGIFTTPNSCSTTFTWTTKTDQWKSEAPATEIELKVAVKADQPSQTYYLIVIPTAGVKCPVARVATHKI